MPSVRILMKNAGFFVTMRTPTRAAQYASCNRIHS